MNAHHLNLKLYHAPATRSARVKWLLHELLPEDAFSIQLVSLQNLEQYTQPYLERNPNHNVPMLEITTSDGQVQTMLESGAMITLLADLFPEKRLAPPLDSAQRPDYLQMLYFGCSWVDMMLWQIRLHTHLLPEEDRDPRTIARYQKKFRDEVEPQLAKRLQHQTFILGDAFSAADCVMGQNVMWARAYGLCQAEVFRGYMSRFTKRPAFGHAYADAGQFTLQVPRRPNPG
ncbi:MAG: glutathione S-transferase family protein [Proteobacteria bacterium]|jgi:glutathione S-transferase|nr:glutathione S-transferase family protein [Pseudomonadota bacterium]MDA1298894.1 glutathione S-transferase family protein [Pseudomonadota bacterium]